MRKIVSRPNPEQLPSLSLPFHVRSVGYNEAYCNWGELVPGERKDFVQLFWTVDGMGEVAAGTGKFRVGPGEVFCHLPRETHDHRAVDPHRLWRYYWFTFDGPGAADCFLSYGYPAGGFYAGECPMHLFLEIETLLKERTRYAQRHAVSLAAEILALAGGTLESSGECDLVKRFITLAHGEYRDPGVTVESLAASLGVHRTTLNRKFLAAMSLAPGEYLSQIRIQHALSLLRETELPVKEVACECGIAYAGYFCRLIRRETGMSPAEYRRRAAMD
ncbi:MAG: AraC family transcriptional regulator [Lentisphaeria bacterium]|nr:AraC family transcriptional regulator [Lentisphaeria bacterium]